MSWAFTYIREPNARSTIVSLPYNLGALLGGFTGEIVTACMTINGVLGSVVAGLYFSGLILLSLLGVLFGLYFPFQSPNLQDYQLIDAKHEKNYNDYQNT